MARSVSKIVGWAVVERVGTHVAKAVGYATVSPPINAVNVAKAVGYAAVSPPVNAVNVAKVVGYAVVKPLSISNAVVPRSYAEFFLHSPADVVQLELLEISHPNFSTVYRVVRNAVRGVSVTLENGSQQFFAYYPLRISPSAARDTLDFGIRVDVGDLGEIIPTEIGKVMHEAGSLNTFGADGRQLRPTVRYWTYRSDDLTRPLFGPVTLQIETLSMTRDGAAFEAKAPALNVSRTGLIYGFDRFPTLRGFLK